MRVLALVVLATLATAGEAALPAAVPPPVYTAAVTGEVLHANVLRVLGLVLYDVQAAPRLADGVLTFAACQALAYGGALAGEVSVDLASGVQRYQLALKGADLAAFLREFSGLDDGTSGVVDLTLDLTVPPGEALGMTGRGTIVIKEANLLRIGLLASLLVGSVQSAGSQDSASARFEFAGGRVRLDGAYVATPDALFRLRGSVGLDGNLDLLVLPRAQFGALRAIWGLGDLLAIGLRSLGSRVARARIRGHISRPVVVLDPFGE